MENIVKLTLAKIVKIKLRNMLRKIIANRNSNNFYLVNKIKLLCIKKTGV